MYQIHSTHNTLPERSIKLGGEFCAVAEDRDLAVHIGIFQHLTHSADTAVHHVRGRNHMCTCDERRNERNEK